MDDKIYNIKRKISDLELEWTNLSNSFNKRSERMKVMTQSEREDLLIKQEDNLRKRLKLFEVKANLLNELNELEKK